MGYPRHYQVPPDVPGTYHCVSRCVRRAFLCGKDPVTGRSFEHRKQWIENRILELGGIFAVAVHAYAVMSNHVHTVIETDPTAPSRWSNEEVARRWLLLFGGAGDADTPLESRIEHLAANTARIDVLRGRLASLSWFMRCLKEPLARSANKEDDCTGRFWEGRFKNQTLLDDPAVLATMVYVDLNPVRAGIATTPEAGPHTSLKQRIHSRPGHGDLLQPVAASIRSQLIEIPATQYIELVDWTGRELHPGKRGAVPGNAPPILERLSLQPRQWLGQVPGIERRYCRAIGNVDALIEAARRTGLRWLRGIGAARSLEYAARST